MGNTPHVEGVNSASPSPEVLEPHPFARAVRDKLEPLLRYSRTRRAIRRGELLFDFSPDRLRANDYLGPWSFNLAESAFAAAPIVVIMKFLTLIWPAPEVDLSSLTEAQRLTATYQLAIAGWLQPFLAPLILLLMAPMLGRATLHGRDSSPERRQRAKWAYLYFDGAFGIVPQFCFVLTVTLSIWLTQRQFWTSELGWAMGALGLYSWGHLLYVSASRVPKMLFALHGYSTKAVHFWTRRSTRPSNPAPWSKYSTAFVLGGGIVSWGTILAFSLAIYVIARFFAALRLATG